MEEKNIIAKESGLEEQLKKFNEIGTSVEDMKKNMENIKNAMNKNRLKDIKPLVNTVNNKIEDKSEDKSTSGTLSLGIFFIYAVLIFFTTIGVIDIFQNNDYEFITTLQWFWCTVAGGAFLKKSIEIYRNK